MDVAKLLARSNDHKTLLERKDVISWTQRDHIQNRGTNSEKVDILLDVMMRRSYGDLKSFVGCLCETGQQDAAKILCGELNNSCLSFSRIC